MTSEGDDGFRKPIQLNNAPTFDDTDVDAADKFYDLLLQSEGYRGRAVMNDVTVEKPPKDSQDRTWG